MGLPYRLVLTVACVLLAGRYVFDREASPWGRAGVAIVTATSFLLPEDLPDHLVGYIAAAGIQFGVSMFVLLWLKATAD